MQTFCEQVREVSKGTVELLALRPSAAGEAVTLNYGADLTNDFLLMDYGFMVPGSPADQCPSPPPPDECTVLQLVVDLCNCSCNMLCADSHACLQCARWCLRPEQRIICRCCGGHDLATALQC